jgi:hypothetical protein
MSEASSTVRTMSKPSYEIPGLRELHQEMRRVKVDRCSFSYRDGRAQVTVAFLVDEAPYALLIVVRGPRTYCFELKVHPGYRVDAMLGEHYGPLKDALGIISSYTSTERWKPRSFFDRLGENTPTRLPPNTPPVPPELITQVRRDVDEASKVYFVGWIMHGRGSGKHVTAANLDKTRRLLSPKFADRCARSNMSSVWSDDPARKREIVPPPA